MKQQQQQKEPSDGCQRSEICRCRHESIVGFLKGPCLTCFMSERPVIATLLGLLMVCDLVPLQQLLFSFFTLEHWFTVQFRAEEVFCG